MSGMKVNAMLRRSAFILPVLLISSFLVVSLLAKPATTADGSLGDHSFPPTTADGSLGDRSFPATTADGSLGYRSFKDASNGSMLTVALQDAGANQGKFQFAVTGAGLFWPRDRATVTVNSDNSVVVGYDGPGFADTQAVIDSAFGHHQRSGEALPVTVRLEAQVNPDGITASARLWVNGVLYALNDQRPTLDADADLLTILGAFQSQDWAVVYSWTYSGVRSEMTETEFVAASTQAFSADGSVVHATRTGPVSYATTGAGFDTATARVALTMSSGRIVNADASLIWEDGRWALLSIAPGP